MKYTVDNADRPIYLHLYKQIRDDIISGVFSYKSRLPSKRLLADELGVSTVTVEHAYALLCDEGYAEARERSGYFVIFRQSDGFAASAPASFSILIPSAFACCTLRMASASPSASRIIFSF